MPDLLEAREGMNPNGTLRWLATNARRSIVLDTIIAPVVVVLTSPVFVASLLVWPAIIAYVMAVGTITTVVAGALHDVRTNRSAVIEEVGGPRRTDEFRWRRLLVLYGGGLSFLTGIAVAGGLLTASVSGAIAPGTGMIAMLLVPAAVVMLEARMVARYDRSIVAAGVNRTEAVLGRTWASSVRDRRQLQNQAEFVNASIRLVAGRPDV